MSSCPLTGSLWPWHPGVCPKHVVPRCGLPAPRCVCRRRALSSDPMSSDTCKLGDLCASARTHVPRYPLLGNPGAKPFFLIPPGTSGWLLKSTVGEDLYHRNQQMLHIRSFFSFFFFFFFFWLKSKEVVIGVPSVAQRGWCYPCPAQWVKDLVQLQLQLRSQLQLGSAPWPRQLHMPWGGQK